MHAPESPSLTLEKIATLDTGGQRLAVSADGHRVAVGTSEDVVLIRDLAPERTLEAPSAIDRLRFAPDGKTLLAAPEVVDLESLVFVPLPSLVPALAHGLDGLPSGQLIVRRADFTHSGEETIVYAEHVPPRGLGKGGESSGPGGRILWMRRNREVLSVPWTGARFAVTTVVAGSRFVVAGGATLMVWDRLSRVKVAEIGAHALVVRDVALSEGDTLLASVGNDHRIVLTDTKTWQSVATWKSDEGDTTGVALHPRRPVVATTGQDGAAKLWSLDGKLITHAPLGAAGTAVAFATDGTRLYALTDGQLLVFAVH